MLYNFQINTSTGAASGAIEASNEDDARQLVLSMYSLNDPHSGFSEESVDARGRAKNIAVEHSVNDVVITPVEQAASA